MLYSSYSVQLRRLQNRINVFTGGLVKSDKAFGCGPMRRKVEEHSTSDRHPSSTPPILFSLLNSHRNADKRVNTAAETLKDIRYTHTPLLLG